MGLNGKGFSATGSRPATEDETKKRLRACLQDIAQRGVPIIYRDLAETLGLEPPNTIHQLAELLETLMVEDAAAGRPFIAALVVSKARPGLPAPGFFDCARRLGRFAGDLDARAYHAQELAAASAFWRDVGQGQDGSTAAD
jgi:hypothetical protein